MAYVQNRYVIEATAPELQVLHGQPRIDNGQPAEGVQCEEVNNEDANKMTTFQMISHGISAQQINLGCIVVPFLLNIWNVILFLNLSWIVAESGIIQTLIIIALSSVVCVITTLSLSAISTNGEAKGGGVCFIISRSLRPEFGVPIGVMFAIANTAAVLLNISGFRYVFIYLLNSQGIIIFDYHESKVEIFTILVLMLISCCGGKWPQNFLIVLIVLAIFNFFIGAGVGPQGDVEKIAQGFVGFSSDIFKANLGPSYRSYKYVNGDFFSSFANFFPGVACIQAVAYISGDRKDAAKSISKGTILALVISLISNALFVVFFGSAALRDASGDVADLVNGTLVGVSLPCALNDQCQYGLANNSLIMKVMSAWQPLFYAGCFAALLGTALINLLSVPRLIQALGNIFSPKPHGTHGKPYWGYVLTFIISSGFLWMVRLNETGPIIVSNFYLASYALINVCTFHGGFNKPVGSRPTYKVYNAWLSLFGFFACVAMMFLIGWLLALITVIIIFALYLVMVCRKRYMHTHSDQH